MSDTDVTVSLRQLRESAGISLREAARIVGVGHQSTYAHYEDGRRYKRSYIPPEIIEPLAAEFEKRGINPQPLWDLSGGQHKVAMRTGLADVGITPWEPTPPPCVAINRALTVRKFQTIILPSLVGGGDHGVFIP